MILWLLGWPPSVSVQIVCEKKQDWQLQEERRTEQVKLWDEAGDGKLSQTPFGDPDGTLYFSWLMDVN